MIQYLWLLAKRLAVLLPGAVVAYFSVRTVFPFVDHKIGLGDALSIFLTYIIAAYILIPAVIRFLRILRPPEHLPLYCVTPDGFASDPLNIGIVASRRQLIQVMERSGWYVADPHTPVYMTRHFISIITGRAYPTAPVSSLFLFGRRQDLAFEIPVEGAGATTRHHVRFWATTFQDKKRMTVRSIHWHHRRSHVQGDDLLWVGAASLDTGIAPIRHNLQITHMIHPDTNQERKLIVEQLKAAKQVEKTQSIKLGDPYRLLNRAWRGYLHTDGKMTIVHLKPEKKPKVPLKSAAKKPATGRRSRSRNR